MPVMCGKKHRNKQTLDDDSRRGFHIQQICLRCRGFPTLANIQGMLGVFLDLNIGLRSCQCDF